MRGLMQANQQEIYYYQLVTTDRLKMQHQHADFLLNLLPSS